MLQSTKRIFICPFLKGGESENFCKVDSGDIKMINHQWKPFVTHLSACLNVWLCYAKELLKNEAWQTLFEWYPGETSIEDEIIWGAPFMFKAKDLGYLTVTLLSVWFHVFHFIHSFEGSSIIARFCICKTFPLMYEANKSLRSVCCPTEGLILWGWEN